MLGRDSLEIKLRRENNGAIKLVLVLILPDVIYELVVLHHLDRFYVTLTLCFLTTFRHEFNLNELLKSTKDKTKVMKDERGRSEVIR